MFINFYLKKKKLIQYQAFSLPSTCYLRYLFRLFRLNQICLDSVAQTLQSLPDCCLAAIVMLYAWHSAGKMKLFAVFAANSLSSSQRRSKAPDDFRRTGPGSFPLKFQKAPSSRILSGAFSVILGLQNLRPTASSARPKMLLHLRF